MSTEYGHCKWLSVVHSKQIITRAKENKTLIITSYQRKSSAINLKPSRVVGKPVKMESLDGQLCKNS